MLFDFESLVGHLYIVSGRSINANPPGMLVEVAPRKAARGREMDTFFGLVLPSGPNPAPVSFYERMAQLGAEQYFASSGSVTSGVRTLFNALNTNLFEHNESAANRPYEALMICAILHGSDVFLARVGGGVAMLQTHGTTQVFPSSFDNDEALYGPPLGVQPVPDIKMTHYRLDNGARLILADNSLADFEMAAMETSLARANLGEVLLGFKAMTTGSLTLLSVEFVPPETVDQVAVRSGHSTRPEAAAQATPTPAPAVAVASASSNRSGQTVSKTSYRVHRGASAVALKLADGIDTLGTVVERIGEETARQPGRITTFLSSSGSVLIPVALVILVVAMWLSGTGASEFELCVGEADGAANLARGIASNDVTGTLAAWNAVLLTTERCNEIRAGDQQLAALTREGQTIIDQLNEIERRDAVPIEAFPNATLTTAVIRGEDLYVLDDGNDQVYRITLSEDGMSMLPNTRQPIATMRRGASVGAYTLDDILDITWSEDGSGLSQGNVLLALDRNGVLVEYSPTFLARGVQKLLGTEQWKNPIKMAAWRGRLYILDPGADQIWRYDPSGGTFPGAPLEYFLGTRRPTLANAIDFGIDDTGRVYILFADGVIAMFRSGEELRFGFAGFPPNQAIESSYAMFLNTNPVAPGIYVSDRVSRTVYETSMAGTFISSYRTYDETQFNLLSDVAVDETKRVIYALSGNSILAFSK
ncbi:MAG: hypothetical protein K8J31_04385 [Anaerolineae bacterium]|nr:hypothetical protein [Anaerolineae bacterium]